VSVLELELSMKIINISKNTFLCEDIDLHVPYRDGEVEEIPSDQIKRSRCLRSFLMDKTMCEIVDYDPEEKIEASIVYRRSKSATRHQSEQEQQEEDTQIEVQSAELLSVDRPLEVKVHGIFYDAGGYGKVNRCLARKLKQAGYTVRIDPKRSQNQLSADELSDLVEMEKVRVSRDHVLIDSIIPSFAELSTGKYKVLYTTIESYTVPKQFIDCCELYDEIWLTSEWSAEILRKYVNKPIYTVPTGVDPELYTEDGPRFDLSKQTKGFVFLSVFGWNYRKGPDVLCRAYFDEFTEEDDVTLLIMSRYQNGFDRQHREKIRNDVEKYMQEFPNRSIPHLVRYGQMVAEKDMPKLYRSANAFVLPSRGEGGCLPPLEASLCGLPVIMTNVSGQQGYLRPDNAYLIEMDRLEEITPGTMHLHYWDGQKFPALKSKEVHMQLRKAMREVYENYADAQRRNKRLQRMVLEKFTWNNTANAASERLQAIAKKLRGEQ
jgi:glycosyltransferase involved in cell wall biosynthesis